MEKRYYVALARRGSHGKDEVIVKLGHIPAACLKSSPYGEWPRFWFGVHRALCLANVDRETYDATMQLIGFRVTPPKREELSQLMQEQLKRAEKIALTRWNAALGEAKRWRDESEKLETVQKKSKYYLE